MFRLPVLSAVFVLLLAGCVSAGPDLSADGHRAVATADVNLRAGPGTRFPVVDVVRRGATVAVIGCLADRAWCDVGYQGRRGWLSSRYISTFYDRNQVFVARPLYATPVIVFDFGYWDRWYRSYPWYGQRWRHPPRRYPDWRSPPRRNDVYIYPRGGPVIRRND